MSKDKKVYAGLLFTMVAAAIGLWMGDYFFGFKRLTESLFDCGVDCVGTLVCAGLFYGCMKYKEEGSDAFKILIVLTSASFVTNLGLLFFEGLEAYKTLFFALCILSKLLDIFLIYFFYLYVRKTLEFEGKLASWAEHGIPILMVVQIIILLINIVTPLTFYVDTNVAYKATSFSFLEDIFLVVLLIITTVLIIKAKVPRDHKAAALSFIILPVAFYIAYDGAFGYASQYGAILITLVIMFAVISNYKNGKLAATQSELNMAKDIQASMLPSIFPAFPEREEFDLYASMDPAKEVGGDFYDFFMIDDDHLGLIIADVSGKGVPAALFMMISKTILQNFAKIETSASDVLYKANNAICAQNKMEMFVTTWLGILDIKTGKLSCANAGHEYPTLYHDGKFELIKDKHGMVIGGMDGVPYKEYDIELKKGDKVFVYTDGVPEATNAETEMYGTDRMMEALNNIKDGSPKEILEFVRQDVDKFVAEAEQFDDLTMLCLEYKG